MLFVRSNSRYQPQYKKKWNQKDEYFMPRCRTCITLKTDGIRNARYFSLTTRLRKFHDYMGLIKAEFIFLPIQQKNLPKGILFKKAYSIHVLQQIQSIYIFVEITACQDHFSQVRCLIIHAIIILSNCTKHFSPTPMKFYLQINVWFLQRKTARNRHSPQLKSSI